jgi:hypothetical protein
MVVAAMLDHARDENEDPVFVLKGGAAMELRLGLRARATKYLRGNKLAIALTSSTMSAWWGKRRSAEGSPRCGRI